MLALPRFKQILIFSRLHLRRTALRLLSSSPSSFVAKPRTVTSFASSTLRIPRQSNSVTSFQRRWATGEAEVKKEQGHEAPISEIQPTPQQEVENAIHEGNTAELKSKPAAEAEGSSEPTREEAKAATNTTESGVNTATEAVSNAASS